MKILGLVMLSVISMLLSGTASAKSFTDNGDHTITDNETTLVWQKAEGGAKEWEAAISYCENLALGVNNTAWRLPSKRELISLLDYTRVNPALDRDYFPHVDSSYYWSSTTDAGRTGDAWSVYFANGSVNSIQKADQYKVRCVRGGL